MFTHNCLRMRIFFPSPHRSATNPPKDQTMKRFHIALLASLTAMSLHAATNAPSSIIAPGAKLEKLSGEFQFTEGPSHDANGNVFFTDQPNNRIMKWSVDGKLTEFMKPAGRANGMFFEP